jgi:hypothetical protein
MVHRFFAAVSSSACASLLALSMIAPPSSVAQVDAANAGCRKAIGKAVAKYDKTVRSSVGACVAAVLKGKRPTSTDCFDLSPAGADDKGKIAAAAGKLTDAISGAKAKCDGVAHALSLGQHSVCPSPGSGSTITSFADLSACLVDLVGAMAVQFEQRILAAADYQPIKDLGGGGTAAKSLIACSKKMDKAAGKLAVTVAKERLACIQSSDKAGGPYNVPASCLSDDPTGKGKIAKARLKLDATLTKSCSLPAGDLALLGACGATPASLGACLRDAEVLPGGPIVFGPDGAANCPAKAVIDVHARGRDGARQSDTRLDVGWSGFGHDLDFLEGTEVELNLNCPDTSCSGCTPSLVPFDGLNPAHPCRCDGDAFFFCSTFNGPDPACGGGNCTCFMGPPLPNVGAGVPVCTTSRINADIGGVVDPGTGAATLDYDLTFLTYNGVSYEAPCHTCDGDVAPNDGNLDGTCSGGARAGLVCDANGDSSSYGATSFDCPPLLAERIGSNNGIRTRTQLTTGTSTLPDDTFACDVSPLLGCPCGLCAGGEFLGCKSNADCTAAGIAGPCTSPGIFGVASLPNGCNTIDCVDGECALDPPLDYCSAPLVDAEGKPNRLCNPGFDDCGAVALGSVCSESRPRSCFEEDADITLTGRPGFVGSELVGTSCLGASTAASVTAALGLAGPAAVRLEVDFTPFCADGTTAFDPPSGAGCD